MGYLTAPVSGSCHCVMAKSKKSKERYVAHSFLRSAINKFALLAGEINWNAHITSSAHFENVEKAAAIPSKTLHSFFNEKATSSPFEAPRSLSTLDPFAHLRR